MIKSVSVIIPTFNGERFLGSTLSSVFNQTFEGKIECIVIDDGSSDESLAVAKTFDGVKVKSQKNAGQAAARNTGLAESTGDAIVFLDQDDLLLPENLECNSRLLNLHPELNVVAGQRIVFRDDAELTTLSDVEHELPGITDLRTYTALLRGDAFVPPSCAMFRRSTLEELGGFRSLEPVEDLDLYLRISQGAPIGKHNRKIVGYRRHAGNMSNDGSMILTELLSLLSTYEAEEGSNPVATAAIAEGRRHWVSLFGPRLLMNAVLAIKDRRFGVAARSLRLLVELKLSRRRRLPTSRNWAMGENTRDE